MAGERILVVEDNSMIALRLRMGLIKLGYDAPDSISYGEEALQAVEKLRPDLIFMDIDLAGTMDGIETAVEIRKKVDIPVLFLTSYVEDTVIERAKAAEPYGYLVKPIHEQDLRATIEMALHRHKLEIQIKEKDAQIRHIQKMESIGRLAGGIAHDFNNIISIILGNAELAIDDTPEWLPAREFLNEIKTACLRAKDVVRQLLNFARKSESNREPLEVNLIVSETLKLIRASIPATIEIRTDITEDPHTILADPTQIHQVLINFCANAAHAMRETGGLLEVTLNNVEFGPSDSLPQPDMKPGHYVRLAVQDTGHGIPPQYLNKIFDPYFTTKEVGEGPGMGLSVVHGIVKSHEGVITVQSEVGRGTLFEVFFPVIHPEKLSGIPNKEAAPTGDETILLVDDEAILVKMLRMMLERLGYRVEAFQKATEALDRFRAEPDHFKLLITDMTMPDMTGDQLANEIFKIRPGFPVILCTGYSDRINEEKARALGIRGYLEKPINKSRLAKTIRNALKTAFPA